MGNGIGSYTKQHISVMAITLIYQLKATIKVMKSSIFVSNAYSPTYSKLWQQVTLISKIDESLKMK